MVEPLPPNANDTCNGDATHPTGEPDPAPTDVEPPHPPVGDTEAGDATHPTGQPESTQPDTSPLRNARLKFDVHYIPIDDVLVVGPRRALNEQIVAQLMRSIERIGLQMPITVRVQKNVPHPETGEVLESAYPLVVGKHRREACRRLGWQHIPAINRDCSELEARLWEVDENLARAELTIEEKAEHTMRLAAVINEMEERLNGSDLPKQGAPATGRGHKGTIQKVAERIGVDQGTVRHRKETAEAMIREPVDLDRDSPAELRRKADKLNAMAADHKAGRKKQRNKTQAKAPSRKEPEKTQATMPPRQPDLAVVIRDLNVAWSPAAIETAAASLTDAQKADLRDHLPNVIDKFQQLADCIGLRSTIAAPDKATGSDQLGLFGSN